MKKVSLHFQVPVSFLKEKKRFIAYSPVLDLSTSGKTFEQAKKRFEEASNIFFEEIVEMGTMDDVLINLGWVKFQKTWQPPLTVGQSTQSVQVPCLV